MTVTVRNKTDLVVPDSVRRQAGIKAGDRLEFRVSGGVINIIPKLLPADDGDTPEQRSIINARLAEARKGPYHGPFNTAGEAIKFLHKEIKARKAIAMQVVLSDRAIEALKDAPAIGTTSKI